MIDWFPRHESTGAGDDARRLRRFQGEMGLCRLAARIEERDPATAGHSGRVADLAGAMAESLGWSADAVRALRGAALLHGIGSSARIDGGALAPLPLRAAMSARIVAGTLRPEAVEAIRHLHERWDGEGGPDGLRGHEIPPAAQLLAAADAFDTFACIGPYGPVRNLEALGVVRRESGRRLAPWAASALTRAVRARPDVEPVPVLCDLLAPA